MLGSQARHDLFDIGEVANACVTEAPVRLGNHVFFGRIELDQIANVGLTGGLIRKDAPRRRFNVEYVLLDRLANERNSG